MKRYRNAARRATSLASLAFLLAACAQAHAALQSGYSFSFGPGPAPAGYAALAADTVYSSERGYGFEPGASLSVVHDDDPKHARGTYLRADQPFFFTVDLPEGNYNVTLGFGDKTASSLTVKSELRRLMLENVRTAPGEIATRTFTVNVRTPLIRAVRGLAPGEVKLKVPRETVQEAVAWDQRLTLELNGDRPTLRSLRIVPVTVPTIFLLGDSTVCDQPGEPYSSWGQMLPRFFKAGIAVANHAESGETYRDSIARRRLDKILSLLKTGDTVIMQFGHNDQKQIKDGKGGPFTTYKAEIKTHVEAIRQHGGVPVLVSPMERRAFDASGKVIHSLADYAEAARQSAAELNVPFIDLNALSIPFYQALGPDLSKLAFAAPAPGKIDNTHHNNYGSYELAKLVVTALRQSKLAPAAFVVDDFVDLDPATPDAVASFAVQASPTVSTSRPLGDEANK